ncbi:MAG: DUF2085 domain-containing protein [Chloroflexi bacterium]|nr:DUF2085 domain-containing protein [Chloroflexota bacterium]
MNRTTRPTLPTAERTSKTKTEDWALRIAALLTRIVAIVARHWLFLISTALAIEALLPVLAPVLMATGHASAARLIYTLCSPFCHQLPERSFFLFGQQTTYTLHELQLLIGPDVPLRYVGNPAIGYKIAVCQRDIATYLALFTASLAFIPLRHRLRPLPIPIFILLCVPMAIDGLGQLFMLWESTPYSRVISGALFGIACIWLAYPYIEAGMQDVARTLGQTQASASQSNGTSSVHSPDKT